MDILNELQYQFGTKGVLEGTQGKDQATDSYQPTLLQRAVGVTKDQLQDAGDTKQQRDLQREFGGRLGIYGGKSVQRGEDRTSVETRLFERKEDYDTNRRTKAQLELHNNPTARDERRIRDEGIQRNESRYLDLQEQNRLDRNTNEKNRLADRADARESRADDRMMQLEMYERADRKEEKTRRRESIQALVAGLSSLGAAFAV